MYCEKCGKENVDEAVYCAHCGELLKEHLPLSRKGKTLMIITGCSILLLLGFSALAGAGGLYYYFFCKKKPAQKRAQEVVITQTPSQTSESLSREATEALVRKVVEDFYTALKNGEFGRAGSYVTARARSDWFSPEIQAQRDAQLTNFQINLVNRVKEGIYEVIVKETYEDFEGKSYTTLSYSVIKEGERWLLDDVEFVAESFDFPSDSAMNTVGGVFKRHKRGKDE